MTNTTPAVAASIESLRAAVSGAVALPGEPGYELATPWNVAVPVRPHAVVEVESADDVAAAVRYAADHGLKVAVQRTGHGAVPLGDDVLLVHTGRLTECAIDPDARTARLGAGLVWQDVIDAATPHGLAPLAGSSTTVGVAGFLTGGGIGPLVRTYGLSSDYVRAFDIVTGNGEVLHVTPEEHAELFWGLRGGKATLGIVTAVEIELLPVTHFYGGALYFDGSDAAAVAHAWLDWCAELPEHSTTSIAFLQLPPLPQVPAPLAGRLTFAVRFASLADPAEAEALLGRLRAVATPILDGIGTLPFAAIAAVHADPVDPMPTHEYSALTNELTHEAIDALLSVAGPGSHSPQTVVEVRQLGGALAREPRHRSAFCHRDAQFAVMVAGVLAPPTAENVVGHARTIDRALAPWTTGRHLPNFAASADPATIARAYDDDTAHWLSALADEYDSNGVLRVGQVVRRDR
ncbi:FAD-binding oxidoreductase [Rhodococcus sp. HM1]|uniref:FAD-binding oxidoreductase n=1 Tax=Rhodococcus sp. HM1 TaxID=2937759 RepID=UPI00200AD351|nr:FAD-binding oxidoreductase [Rhodococcus sp. HM1]MCK8671718.1 FAD-binding oxidoreductase [Rhodococcus sp. HM1]